MLVVYLSRKVPVITVLMNGENIVFISGPSVYGIGQYPEHGDVLRAMQTCEIDPLKKAQQALLQKIRTPCTIQYNCYEVDHLAMALLPAEPNLPDFSAVKTTSNGNCLFNAVSLILKGNFSDDLFINPCQYT